jgi:hypothetical protein
MALAEKAIAAAVVLAPCGGPSFELRYLHAEPDKKDCRELSDRGLKPIALLAWTKAGTFEWEWAPDLMYWPEGSVAPVLSKAKTEFLAALSRVSGPVN